MSKKSIILWCFFLLLSWSRNWSDITASGVLKAGMRVRPGVLEESRDQGFHYDLVAAFAKQNELRLELVIVDNISEYFKDDAFTRFDLIADNLTITEERKGKADFVSIFPIKQVLVTRTDYVGTPKRSTLDKETLIVTKGTSYYDNLTGIEKAENKKFKYFFSSAASNQLDDLKNKRGTVTVLDSNLAMGISDAAFKPRGILSAKQYIGWACEKGDAEMIKTLESFISKSKRNGTLSDTWATYIKGINYYSYMKIIDK